MAAKRKKDEEKSMSKVETLIYVVAILFFVILALAYLVPKPTTQETLYGVKVVSEFPVEDLKKMEFIALYNTTATPAELTCKFELSAISKPDIRGYRIRIEEGDTGIYLKQKEATIKGSTPADMLNACHAFACIRDGIECPNFMELDNYMKSAKSMSVILDSSVDNTGGRGYAEIIGALSFLQTKKADTNKDGQVDQKEVDANEFFIYPFIKDGDVCTPQPMNTMIQNWSRTNQTVKCADISPAILLTASNESAMRIQGGQIVLTGPGEAVHTEAIIIRDFIAPEWIRRLYGFN
jgi:hypothetical protein